MKPYDLSDAQYAHLCEQFGAAMRECREFVDETQAEWGGRFGVAGVTVCYWERGHGLPRAKTLAKLCRHAGISVDYLFGCSRERHTEKARERAKTASRATAAAR